MTGLGVRCALWAAVVALTMAITACGGAEREQSPAGEPRDRLGGAEKAPSPEEIEQFAEVELPADTEGLQAWARSSVDTSLSFRLAMSRRDFERFYERANFSKELVEGERPSISEEGRFEWSLEAIETPWGQEQRASGFSRRILVDFSNPDRPVVYMTASTT